MTLTDTALLKSECAACFDIELLVAEILLLGLDCLISLAKLVFDDVARIDAGES